MPVTRALSAGQRRMLELWNTYVDEQCHPHPGDLRLSAVRDITPDLSTFLPADRRHPGPGQTLPGQQDGMRPVRRRGRLTPLTNTWRTRSVPVRGRGSRPHHPRDLRHARRAVHRHRSSIVTLPPALAHVLVRRRLPPVGGGVRPRHAGRRRRLHRSVRRQLLLGLKVAVAGGTATGSSSVILLEQLFDVISGEAVDLAGRARMCAAQVKWSSIGPRRISSRAPSPPPTSAGNLRSSARWPRPSPMTRGRGWRRRR